MPDVVALGELLIDFAAEGAGEDGYPVLRAQPGGAPANFLAALAKYGAKTALIGKVGADAFGALLLDSLRRAGIETRGVVEDPESFTTLAFVTLDGRGERTFSFARKPGADTLLRAGEVDFGLIGEARCFHFGSLSLTDEPARAATRAAAACARAGGKLVTFDPNLRRPLWRDLDEAGRQMLWGMGQADVVKLSGEEGEFLFSAGPERTARILLEEYGVALAFVTLGPGGCYCATRRHSCTVPAPTGIRPVDTTGAGTSSAARQCAACWSWARPRRRWSGRSLRTSPASPAGRPGCPPSGGAASPACPDGTRWRPCWQGRGRHLYPLCKDCPRHAVV